MVTRASQRKNAVHSALTASLTRFDKALQNIREAEMLVYSVGIKGAPVFDMGSDSPSGTSRSRTLLHTSIDMGVLNRFGEASGGRAWEISEAACGKKMDAVLDTIAAELASAGQPSAKQPLRSLGSDVGR